MKLLKENKLLTAITVIHLFIGPFLYHWLGLIRLTYRNSSAIDLSRLLDIGDSNLFYWVVTVVLVFMFWLFKK